MRPYLLAVVLAAACRPAAQDADPVDERPDTDASAADTALPPGLPGLDGAEPGLFQDTASAEEADAVWTGAWRDLDAWTRWLDLTALTSPWRDEATAWGLDLRQRYTVSVTDAGGAVLDAEVALIAGDEVVWTARTDALGRAELFAGLEAPPPEPASGWTLAAKAGGRVAQVFNVPLQPSDVRDVGLSDSLDLPEPAGIDIAWLIDPRVDRGPWSATALPALVADLEGLLADEDPAGVRLAAGWATPEPAPTALSADPDAALAVLDVAAPATTLDLPAALDALAGLEWSAGARARLAVLWLGDGPDPATLQPLGARIEALAARGVRLVIVGATPDPRAGFLWRQMAIGTGGTWIFELGPGRPLRTDLVGPYTPAGLSRQVAAFAAAVAGPTP